MKIDAQDFDRIARTVFAPVYPVIADQIIARTGVTQGVCLDIGCGSGYLGTALAHQTNLYVYFFDKSNQMLNIARKTIADNDLGKRADTLYGDVTTIGLPDNSVDLVVSRGSIYFWDDMAQAFQEIDRVLTQDGWAYIGGGFGTYKLQESIESEMKSHNQGSDKFSIKVRRNMGPEARSRFEAALDTASINTYTIDQDKNIGLWIVMRKSTAGRDLHKHPCDSAMRVS